MAANALCSVSGCLRPLTSYLTLADADAPGLVEGLYLEVSVPLEDSAPEPAPRAECERPVADGLSLCQTCTDGVVTDLREVPSLLAELAITRAATCRLAARTFGRDAPARAGHELPRHHAG
ncbi:hypothetical protein GCM10023319_19260 [Nocardia iowensis]